MLEDEDTQEKAHAGDGSQCPHPAWNLRNFFGLPSVTLCWPSRFVALFDAEISDHHATLLLLGVEELGQILEHLDWSNRNLIAVLVLIILQGVVWSALAHLNHAELFDLGKHLDNTLHHLHTAQPNVDWPVPFVGWLAVCIAPNSVQFFWPGFS